MRKRIKDLVTLRNVKSEERDSPYIALENIKSWDATFVETAASSEGINNAFKKNDILFGKLRPYLAKGYIPEYDGICSSEFLVMTANEGMNNRYLLYSFLSHSFIDYISNQVAGVKMPRTNWNSFANVSIEAPEKIDQDKIVNYLDSQSNIIDHRISILTKKRDCYLRLKTSTINRAVTRGLNPDVSFKDSGIEWIGDIPEHWNITAIKRLGKLIGGNGFKDEYQGYYSFDIPFIKVNSLASNISINNQYDTISKELLKRENYSLIKKGSIVFAKVGAALLLHRFCILPFDSCIDNNMMAFTSESIYMNWAKYACTLIDFTPIVNPGPVPSVNQGQVGRILLPIPPLSEQQAIAAYLDEKCAKIDAAIANIDKQIDALKRLKRALINEVVTGKREI